MLCNEDINILKLYEESGIDESYLDKPYNFFERHKPIFSKTPSNISQEKNENISILEAKNSAIKEVENINDIETLQNTIKNFKLNPLSKFASNSVNGCGVSNPKLLVITEIPNSEEDKTGIPLSGDTGELLKKILKAINSSIEIDTFYFPISFLRPAGGRLPTPEEIEISLPFAKKMIDILSPKIILTMGSLPITTLLNTNETITSIRGKWQNYNDIKIMPTFSLSQIMTNIDVKKKTWEDLQLVITELTSL